MKKTITLLLCGLGLQAQAATLVWNQTDLDTPASITDSGSWTPGKAPGSGDELHFNGKGNVLIDSELTADKIQFNTGGTANTVNLTLDFASAGKLTSNAHTNFSQNWFQKEGASITFKAILAPQETGTTGSRELLRANGDYGIWNFADLFDSGNEKYASAFTGDFGGYQYLGLIQAKEWDALSATMNDGEAYLVYTGGNDAPNGIEVRWKGGAAVPEPTTSTLSLLALAGLCLRRRRCA